MPWGNDSEWWKRRIRQELEHSDEVGMDDLPRQPGMPEGLIEAVDELEEGGEITVVRDEGQRLIHKVDDQD